MTELIKILDSDYEYYKGIYNQWCKFHSTNIVSNTECLITDDKGLKPNYFNDYTRCEYLLKIGTNIVALMVIDFDRINTPFYPTNLQ